MDEYNKVMRIGIIILVLIGLSVGTYFVLVSKKGAKPAAQDTPAEIAAAPPSEETEAENQGGALDLPPLELNKSDDLLRQLAQDVSSHPRLASWLRTEDLVRKFVAAVDNIADGQVPRSQIDFFQLGKPFTAAKKDGQLYIDPGSYERYNPIADVFISLDTKATIRLYRALKPLLQEAYRELGYPDVDFEGTLIKATIELLAVPVPEGRIYVEKKVTTYTMTDDVLEGMSPAQKQFLRMGPDNVQVIQTKLREMALALGVPESVLPKVRFYHPL